MKQEMNWSYIAGLIESDGSIECFLDKDSKQLKYIVKITSKKNANTLDDVKFFLKEKGFVAGSTDLGAEERGPSIRIQGNTQVVKFLKELQQQVSCLEGGNYKCPLLGVKLRNMRLILAVPDQATLTMAQKIDFKKTFHKENYEQEDIKNSYSITRSSYEERYGLALNSSRNSFQQSIKEIDIAYSEHVAKVASLVECGKLNAYYVVGLFDGDGGFNVVFSISAYDKRVDIICEINLCLPKSDAFIHDVLKKHFGTIKTSLSKSSGSVQMKIRQQKSVETVIAFFDTYPLLGNYKSEGLALLKDTLAKKQANYFRKGIITPETFKEFIEKKLKYCNLRGETYDKLFKFIDDHYE